MGVACRYGFVNLVRISGVGKDPPVRGNVAIIKAGHREQDPLPVKLLIHFLNGQ